MREISESNPEMSLHCGATQPLPATVKEPGITPAQPALPAMVLGQSPALIRAGQISTIRPIQFKFCTCGAHQARTDCKVADNILIIGVHIPTNAGGPKCQQGPFRFNE